MPCDTVSTTEADPKKFNGPLFLEALKKLGAANPRHNAYKTYSWDRTHELPAGSYDSRTGEFTFRESRMSGTEGAGAVAVNRIKQAYSGQVLQSQAKRFGWSLKETGPNQYVIAKR